MGPTKQPRCWASAWGWVRGGAQTRGQGGLATSEETGPLAPRRAPPGRGLGRTSLMDTPSQGRGPRGLKTGPADYRGQQPGAVGPRGLAVAVGWAFLCLPGSAPVRGKDVMRLWACGCLCTSQDRSAPGCRRGDSRPGGARRARRAPALTSHSRTCSRASCRGRSRWSPRALCRRRTARTARARSCR